MAHADTSDDAAMFEREIAERLAMARECPIDVYCASVNPRWAWPYKLNRSGDPRHGTARSCDTMLVDAGYGFVTDTMEIAMTANRTDADLVVARDLSAEHPIADDDPERHVKSARLSLATASILQELGHRSDAQIGQWAVDHDAAVMLPLQPPYEETLDWLSIPRKVGDRAPRYVTAFDAFDHVAAGGLQDLPTPRDRIQALETVREYLGDDVHVHALAPGTEPEMLRALRRQPGLVDSLDVSTPERAIANNKVPDKTGTQHPIALPTGTDVSTVRAGYSAAIAMQLAFLLTPSKCDDELFEVATEQVGLDAWGEA